MPDCTNRVELAKAVSGSAAELDLQNWAAAQGGNGVTSLLLKPRTDALSLAQSGRMGSVHSLKQMEEYFLLKATPSACRSPCSRHFEI